jgi:hypothetical protein
MLKSRPLLLERTIIETCGLHLSASYSRVPCCDSCSSLLHSSLSTFWISSCVSATAVFFSRLFYTRLPTFKSLQGQCHEMDIIFKGLNIMISTLCECANGFQGLPKAFHYPFSVISRCSLMPTSFAARKMRKN